MPTEFGGFAVVVTLVMWMAFIATCFSGHVEHRTRRMVLWVALGFTCVTAYGLLLMGIQK